MRFGFVLLLFFNLPMVANASSNIITDVEWVGQRGNGNVAIKFKDTIDETGCPNKEIEIESTNPSATGLLSVAMAAYISDVRVNVKSDGCFNGVPTIVANGYITFLAKP